MILFHLYLFLYYLIIAIKYLTKGYAEKCGEKLLLSDIFGRTDIIPFVCFLFQARMPNEVQLFLTNNGYGNL